MTLRLLTARGLIRRQSRKAGLYLAVAGRSCRDRVQELPLSDPPRHSARIWEIYVSVPSPIDRLVWQVE